MKQFIIRFLLTGCLFLFIGCQKTISGATDPKKINGSAVQGGPGSDPLSRELFAGIKSYATDSAKLKSAREHCTRPIAAQPWHVPGIFLLPKDSPCENLFPAILNQIPSLFEKDIQLSFVSKEVLKSKLTHSERLGYYVSATETTPGSPILVEESAWNNLVATDDVRDAARIVMHEMIHQMTYQGAPIVHGIGLDLAMAAVGDMIVYEAIERAHLRRGNTLSDEWMDSGFRAWYTKVHLDLLGKTPTGSELATALEQLRQSGREELLRSIMRRLDFWGHQIARMYQRYLNRSATDEEILIHARNYSQNYTSQSFRDARLMFLGSLEFYQASRDITDHIRRLYVHALDRDPESLEVIESHKNGIGNPSQLSDEQRLRLATSFVDAPERRFRFSARLSQEYLGRIITQAELDVWANTGHTEEDIWFAFFLSDTYFSHSQNAIAAPEPANH